MTSGAATELTDSLLRPAAFPHAADDLQLHETHGSWVILAGPYAYKIKKPVDLGFVDFRTAERRVANAEEELRLNRRLAPSAYLGLVDVVRREDGSIKIGGEGTILERAVWMRRLPPEGMLRRVVNEGRATPRLMRRIARLMASFHGDAPTGPGVDEHGSLKNIERLWRENLEQAQPFVGRTLGAESHERIRRFVDDFIANHRALFARRVREGRIRDGHGDLHADSICLLGSRIVPFDCLEFNPSYRCGDVATEVAFLAMDLDAMGRADLGWHFVDAYLKASNDAELTELLPFYKSSRAFVRGKVRSLLLNQASSPGQGQVQQEAESYFQLSTAYAGGVARPTLLVMCGLPASGKSTLAQSLARRLGLAYISTDVLRKERPRSTELYSSDQVEANYRRLRRRAGLWLRRGVPVILDGTFGDRRQRAAARALAERWGASFLMIHVQCDEKNIRERLARRARQSDSPSDATWEVYLDMRERFQPPAELPRELVLSDPSGGANPSAMAATVLALH